MKNAVNSMKTFKKDNIEPSLVGNYLEGVTTRVEPTVKTMAIITHSIGRNLIEKRSAPFVGDEIVCSAWRHAELSGNDLATFGEFNFNMTGTTVGNKVINMVCRFPIAIKRNIWLNVVNIKSLSNLGFGKSAKLASVIISLTSLRRLLTPVLTFISLNITFISPMVRASSNSSRTPYSAFKRAILAISFSSLMRKGLATIRAYLRNLTFITRVILTRINLATKLQRTFTAASLFHKRPFRELITTDETSLSLNPTNTPALSRTESSIPAGKFLTTDNTFIHNIIIA